MIHAFIHFMPTIYLVFTYTHTHCSSFSDLLCSHKSEQWTLKNCNAPCELCIMHMKLCICECFHQGFEQSILHVYVHDTKYTVYHFDSGRILCRNGNFLPILIFIFILFIFLLEYVENVFCIQFWYIIKGKWAICNMDMLYTLHKLSSPHWQNLFDLWQFNHFDNSKPFNK